MQVQNWNYVTNLNDEYVETKFIRRLYLSVDGFPVDVKQSLLVGRLNNNNRLILLEAFDVTESQSLIRPIMSTLILATNRIYQVMSYKSIQTIV